MFVFILILFFPIGSFELFFKILIKVDIYSDTYLNNCILPKLPKLPTFLKVSPEEGL